MNVIKMYDFRHVRQVTSVCALFAFLFH